MEDVIELFIAQARRSPSATALTFGGESLSYREVDERSDKIAQFLRARGASIETPVALLLERSIAMVVGVLAILKAGAAYVSLEPGYPPTRLAAMTQDAGARWLFTTSALARHLPADFDQVCYLDQELPDSAGGQVTWPVPDSALAGIIFTSGSTGQPKGVLALRRGLANLHQLHREFFPLLPEDRVLQYASFGFDSFIFEVFWAFLAGAVLCLRDRDAGSGDNLAQVLADEAITAACMPPAAIATLPDPSQFPDLRLLISAGEPCPPELAVAWSRNREFFNGYGLTETTVAAAVYDCRDLCPDRPLPIGRPVPGLDLRILDEDLRLVPAGVTGELFVGGPGLARGYAGQAGLTAQRFVPDPFGSPGGRLYRTGDLARWGPGGDLEFAGRGDGQVKIRGLRIEPGEVEAALGGLPGVRRVLVMVREDRPGDPRLVAYLVGDGVAPVPGAAELRAAAGRVLADYMVPAAFVVVDDLPLSANGKVDRRALPAPDYRVEPGGRAPRTAAEEALCGLYADILGTSEVSIDDSFFELGGHSLLAARLTDGIEAEFGVTVGMREIFARPAVAELSEFIDSLSGRQTTGSTNKG